MNFFLVLPYYMVWHYTQGLKDLTYIWISFILYFNHLFSIPNLIKTLFSPWMRINDSYRSRSEPVFDTFVFNTMMRVFGVFVRLIFIVLGVVVLSLTFILGVLSYFVWLFLPFLMIGVFIMSINQFLK